MILPRKLNRVHISRECDFYHLVKTHSPVWHSLECANSLCGSKRSSAFFVRGPFGPRTFYDSHNKYGGSIMKKILRLTVIMVFWSFCVLRLTSSAYAESGSWGSLDWTLDDGLLIISGEGEMQGLSTASRSWRKYSNAITNVIIDEGITSIGNNAFEGCKYLISVKLPTSITQIGDWAFIDCKSLATINFPEGLTSIGAAAFGSCSSLTKITLPSTIKDIGEVAFCNCTSLNSIIIPDGVESIPGRTFENCSRLTDIRIPSSVNSIGFSAFNGCSSLISIDIPLGVTCINDYTFKNCTSLTDLVLPSSIESFGRLAFSGCDNLKAVYINDIGSWCKVKFDYINDNPLYYAKNLFYDGILLQDLIIPSGVNKIGAFTFFGCENIKSITIPASAILIGSEAFTNCTGITDVYYGSTLEKWHEVTVSGGNEALLGAQFHCSVGTGFCGKTGDNMIWNLYDNGLLTISGKGEMLNFEGIYSEDAWRAFSDLINVIKIDNGVNSIGDYAFSTCQQLISVIIPESVETIGFGSFTACNSLTNVTIPKNVSEIGGNAFSVCSKLEKIIVDSENTSYCDIDGVLFDKRQETIIQFPRGKDKEITYSIPDGVKRIGDNAFSLCTNLISVTIPESVEEIGSWAFMSCYRLKSVSFPDSLKTIGYQSFSGCKGLTEIRIPQNVTIISDSAFNGCSNLSKITIEDGVEKIGKGAFYNCDNLTSIDIPSSVESIGQNAFYFAEIEVDKQNMNYCDIDGALFNKDATEILYVPKNKTGIYIIPDTVKHIGDKCFLQCENVTGIVIPYEMISIGTQSFEQCKSLKSIVIPDKVISIDAATFYGCESLENIVIPVSLNYIGDGAFNECGCLKNVYYTGKQTQWTEIMIKQDNEMLNNAIIHYDFHPDLILPESLKALENEAFIGSAFTYVKLSEQTVSIGWRTFADCPYLIAIYIPAATKVIDPLAFGDMQTLTIFGKAGSVAESYSQAHDFSFIAVS